MIKYGMYRTNWKKLWFDDVAYQALRIWRINSINNPMMMYEWLYKDGIKTWQDKWITYKLIDNRELSKYRYLEIPESDITIGWQFSTNDTIYCDNQTYTENDEKYLIPFTNPTKKIRS